MSISEWAKDKRVTPVLFNEYRKLHGCYIVKTVTGDIYAADEYSVESDSKTTINNCLELVNFSIVDQVVMSNQHIVSILRYGINRGD